MLADRRTKAAKGLVHRHLLPGHPARWLVASMAGLLTLRVWASPHLPGQRGQWRIGGRSPLTVAGAVTGFGGCCLHPTRVPFSPGRALLGREPSALCVRRNAARIKAESDRWPPASGRSSKTALAPSFLQKYPRAERIARAGWRGTRQRRDKRLARNALDSVVDGSGSRLANRLFRHIRSATTGAA